MVKIRNCFTKTERRLRFSYNDFIKSVWWERQKNDWFSRHKKACAKCNVREYVQLHHKKYPKNGRYLAFEDNAFIALCRPCHLTYHRVYGTAQNMQTTTNKFRRS